MLRPILLLLLLYLLFFSHILLVRQIYYVTYIVSKEDASFLNCHLNWEVERDRNYHCATIISNRSTVIWASYFHEVIFLGFFCFFIHSVATSCTIPISDAFHEYSITSISFLLSLKNGQKKAYVYSTPPAPVWISPPMEDGEPLLNLRGP